MKNFTDSLAILILRPHVTNHRAAMHLVAAEVVKANPIPPPAVCDAEMRELLTQTIDCPKCRRMVAPFETQGNIYCPRCRRRISK